MVDWKLERTDSKRAVLLVLRMGSVKVVVFGLPGQMVTADRSHSSVNFLLLRKAGRMGSLFVVVPLAQRATAE